MDGDPVEEEPSQKRPITLAELFDSVFPQYLAIGMSSAEYWHGDPKLVRAYRKAWEMKRDQRNWEMWLQGMYYYDALEFSRWFDQKKRWILKSGDVDFALDLPSIVKSRPLHEDTRCNVLLNLEKVRHFLFVNGPYIITKITFLALYRQFSIFV